MKYGWSAETDEAVGERLRLMGLATERLITERLAAGELENIDVLVGYVPIIMPPEHAQRFPARTKVSHKHRVLDCAPQLDYEKFSGESLEVAAKEYVRGIIVCLPLLSRLRFTPSEISQIEDFFVQVSEDLPAPIQDIP